MARSDPQTNIRLPLQLKRRLAEAARENTRTTNAEIVNRLERSFVDQTAGFSSEAESAIMEIRAMVGQLLVLKEPPGGSFPFKRNKAK
jgi:hypothetical protein